MPYPAGASYVALVENLRGSDATFPNANEAIAELRPHSQTIHLRNISRTELRRLIDTNERWRLAPSFSVIAHEIVHWLDLVSTVWGQRYLVELFDAYEAASVQRENPEQEWWKLIHLFDEDRRVMFPRYYRVARSEGPPHSRRRPWSIDYTCGQEFGPDGRSDLTRPIFFTVFGENPGRERVAKQPLSVGTLLETIATWAELLTHITLLNEITDDGEKIVAAGLWSKEMGKMLYDPSLTEYTAPVNLLSARAQTQEVMLSCHTAAAIASVCMNLTEEHFLNLRPPDVFTPFGQERLDAFRNAQDRGFAFACIAFNAPVFSEELPTEDWLANALHQSNLPPIHIIHKDAFATLEMLHRQTTIRTPMDHVRDYLLETGRTVFAHRAEIGSAMTLMDLIKQDVPLPWMFDSEGELFSLGKAKLDKDKFDPETMFNLEWDLRKFTENFLMGCRGVVR